MLSIFFVHSIGTSVKIDGNIASFRANGNFEVKILKEECKSSQGYFIYIDYVKQL